MEARYDGDTATPADVIFIVECSACNGAYIHELRSNYLLPSLEHFGQTSLSKSDDFTLSESRMNQYGVIIYRTGGNLLEQMCESYGPYASIRFILDIFDNYPLTGGGMASTANVTEAMAATLCFFDDFIRTRRENIAERFAILMCNSPPCEMPVMECNRYKGCSLKHLAALFYEQKVNLSIIAPRKIPQLIVLFKAANGEQLVAESKNFAKNIRHLVLLKAYILKNHTITPNVNANVQQQGIQHLPQQQHSLLLVNNHSNASLKQQQQRTSQQELLLEQQQKQASLQMQQQNAQNSSHFTSNSMAAENHWSYATSQQQQQQQRQNQVSPMQIGSSSRKDPSIPSERGPRICSSTVNYKQDPTVLPQPQNHLQTNQSYSACNTSTAQHASSALNASNAQQMRFQLPLQQQQHMSADHNFANQIPLNENASNPIASAVNEPCEALAKTWTGVIEWSDKVKTDQPNKVFHLQCSVTANLKNGVPEVNADNWPPKLLIQFLSKNIINSIGEQILKDCKKVTFHPAAGDALAMLHKILSSGFAGLLNFSTTSKVPACDIKALILLYAADRNAYLGFIPNNQIMFLNRLRAIALARQQQMAGCVVQTQQQYQQQSSQYSQQSGGNTQQLNGIPAQSAMQQQHSMSMQSNQLQQQPILRPVMNNNLGLRQLLQQQPNLTAAAAVKISHYDEVANGRIGGAGYEYTRT